MFFICRLGLLDFYFLIFNCVEEILNRDIIVNGYKEFIVGVEVSYFDKYLFNNLIV